MLKKCVSILLITFLFINSGGFILLFYQAQNSVRHQMFRSLQNGDYTSDEVVTFRISSSRLNCSGDGFFWKDSHEFEYQGEMYDIIKMVPADGEIILYCLNDKSEAKIKAVFNNEINDLTNGKLNNSKYRTSLLNLISQALCLNPFLLESLEDRQEFKVYLGQSILHYVKEIPSPPPRKA